MTESRLRLELPGKKDTANVFGTGTSRCSG
jgi:hypothetical protein